MTGLSLLSPFGNSYELEFDFNNRNVKDDGVITVVPIGNFKPLTR